MILDFRFHPHGAGALTTPSGSPLRRGRDGCEKVQQCNNAACRGFPKSHFISKNSSVTSCHLLYKQRRSWWLFPKTGSISTLPLFIEGNRRVSENRQRVYSLSVEREPIRDRFPGSIRRSREGVWKMTFWTAPCYIDSFRGRSVRFVIVFYFCQFVVGIDDFLFQRFFEVHDFSF